MSDIETVSAPEAPTTDGPQAEQQTAFGRCGQQTVERGPGGIGVQTACQLHAMGQDQACQHLQQLAYRGTWCGQPVLRGWFQDLI